MKKITTAACLFFATIGLTAQNLDWVKTFGTAGNLTELKGVTIDGQKNVYSIGTFGGTIDMDPGTGVSNLTGTNALYVQKLDPSGTFLWAKAITSSGGYVGTNNSICVDASANVYILTSYSGTIDCDPGSGTANFTSGSTNSALIKLDASGNFVYAKNYDTGFTPFTMQYAGNFIYLTGVYPANTNIDFDVNAGTSPFISAYGGGFIQKLDPAWNLIWVKTINKLQVWPYIDVDNSGNVFATGPWKGVVDIDPGPGTVNLAADSSAASGINDVYILKLTSSGSYSWAKTITSPGSEMATAIAIDKSTNDFYIGGDRSNSTDFDPSASMATLAGPANGFIAKYDQNGSYIRANNMPQMTGGITPVAYLACDVAGNIITLGTFNASFDADPGSGTITVSPTSSLDVYMLKLNAAGNYVWSGVVGGSTMQLVQHRVDGNGNIYYGGRMDGTADFDPFAGANYIACQGIKDAYVSKISGCAHNAPDICLVTVDSLANNNVIYWNKSLYPAADSFVVFRYDAFSVSYLRIGAVAASDTNNFLVDTARTVGGPNGGDPQYSSYRYKMAIRDVCGTLGTKGLYHESIFIQQNFQNFSWNAYGIEGQSSPASGYQFLRDNVGSGTWQVLVNTGGLSTTDPNYASYPIGRWRVDALGFSCTTGTSRMANGVLHQVMGAINTSRSNIKSPTSTIGIAEIKPIPVKVYPNPTSDQLMVDFPSMGEAVLIEMRTVLGKVTYSQTTTQLKNTISCANMEAGIYFVRVSSAKGIAIRKITIQ